MRYTYYISEINQTYAKQLVDICMERNIYKYNFIISKVSAAGKLQSSRSSDFSPRNYCFGWTSEDTICANSPHFFAEMKDNTQTETVNMSRQELRRSWRNVCWEAGDRHSETPLFKQRKLKCKKQQSLNSRRLLACNMIKLPWALPFPGKRLKIHSALFYKVCIFRVRRFTPGAWRYQTNRKLTICQHNT
jgi:hypothetical protein